MPNLYLDPLNNIHYTVVHLETRDGAQDPVVFMIKFRGVEWLKAHGGVIGGPLPTSAFETLFQNRWFYPNRGLAPPEARETSLETLVKQPRLGKDDDSHYLSLRLINTATNTNDATIMLVKSNGVAWLQKRNVSVGDQLPSGALKRLFDQKWLYPEPTADAPKSSDRPNTKKESESGDAMDSFYGCLGFILIVGALLLYFWLR